LRIADQEIKSGHAPACVPSWADSLGDRAWVCLTHADEILMTVPAAFIAGHDNRGIAAFLAHR
jgi:hypothetical protein